MARPIVCFGLLGVGVLVVGCFSAAPDGGDGWSGTVDTLVSGRTVVINPDRPVAESRWELRERLRLGSLSAEGPELFGDIAGLDLGPNGDIYVLDGQAAAVRVFDGRGVFRREFGGRGEGPGELKSAAGLALDAQGILWVLNWGNARYSGFDPTTGRIHNEVRRSIGFGQFPWLGDFDEHGHLLDFGLDRGGQVAILFLDSAFVPVDTLRLPQPREDDRIDFRRGSVLVASLLEPFAPSPSWAPRPRGGIMVAEGARYRLHRVGFGADTTMTIQLDRSLVPVTPHEADSALKWFGDMQESLGGVTPTRRPSARDVKPAHGSLFVDDRDRTWVESVRPPGEGAIWDIFDARGRFIGEVAFPEPPAFLRPVVSGTRLALATQSNGFPEVVVYEIIEGRSNDTAGAT